jgi:hypothetical protein
VTRAIGEWGSQHVSHVVSVRLLGTGKGRNPEHRDYSSWKKSDDKLTLREALFAALQIK